jgi:hypothetical protein
MLLDFFDAKKVGKAPTAPFSFFIYKGKHIYNVALSQKKEKLQIINPVLHAFFKLGWL